jgi:hypothetical protein
MNDDMPTPQSLFIEPPRRDRLTAISAGVQRRPIVLVLGMHRSGTSLCSHLLSALGIDMADEIPGPGNASPTSDNPRGHWERWEIVEFHDRILSLFNRDYCGRFHDFALPVAWWADPRVAQIRREIVAFLDKRMGDGYFGFKDPRASRLMPVWHQIFNQLKLAPKVVLCLRNPAQVARSLNARDGLDPEIGEYRWLIHIVDFFRYANNFDFCTVEYEGWFNDPSGNIEKLRKFLDLPWQQSESDLGLVLSGIIDPGARHDDAEHRKASQPLVRSLYELAGRAGQDDAAREQIAFIISQFVGFQQLQRPFQQAFEDAAKIAARYPEIEQEAAVLRAAVSERDAIVQATAGKAAAVEARLAEAIAEIERQQAQIAKVTGERDGRAEIEREVSGLKVTLAERETVLAELSHRADELRAALQVAQAELATREAAHWRSEEEAEERAAAAGVQQAEVVTLREALAQAQRTGQERAAAAEATQAEVVTLREALAQAQRTGQERAATAEAGKAEVGKLREMLARAERTGQESAVAAEAMQAELAALREALAQAERAEQEQTVAAEVQQAEVAALWDALGQAEREAQERAVATEAMQSEIAALRAGLGQAEREAQERAVATEAMQSEIVALRAGLGQAEREAQERAVATEAMQSEIVALQGTLTAARQVGKAAIAAFRIETAAPTKPDRPLGRRQSIMRFFGVRTSY